MEFRRAFDPIRALRVSARLLLRAPLTLIAGGMLLALTAGEWHFERELGWANVPTLHRILFAGIGSVGCCAGLILLGLNSLLRIGYAGAVQRVAVTGEERFADVFQHRGLWPNMMLARVLKFVLIGACTIPFFILTGLSVLAAGALGMEFVGIIVGVVFSLAYLPIWAYVMLGFVLVEEVVAFEGAAPADAVQRSWEIAEGNRLSLLGFAVVTALIQIPLMLLCPIFFVIAMPWVETAWYESFLRFAVTPPEGGMWVDRASE